MKRCVWSGGIMLVWTVIIAFFVIANANAAGPSDQTKKVILQYWDFVDPTQDNPRAHALAKNIARFEELNPDIKIDFQVVGAGPIASRLAQAAAARTGPDVVKAFFPIVPFLVKAGVYQPLDSYVKEVDHNDWLLPWDTTLFDGKKMVLPYEYRGLCLIYRDEALKSVGASVPSTWDELVDTASKLTRGGITGFATGFSVQDNANILMEIFDAFMFQVGQPIVDPKTQAAIFDTEKGLKFFQFMKNLQSKGALTPAVIEGTYTTAQNAIINGSATMTTLGTHLIKVIQTSGGKTVKWAPLPVLKGTTPATCITGWTLGMGAFTKHPNEAWRFINYMTSKEAQVILATGGELPSRLSTFKDPYFSSEEGQLLNDVADYIHKTGKTRIYPTTWTTLGEYMARGMQRMYLENISAEETMRDIVKAYNDHLNQ